MIDFSTRTKEPASSPAQNRAAVILAGGEGSRLLCLTRRITGDDRPKQFCPIVGDQTLLERTRSRIALSVPRGKIFYSLTKKHERFYSRLLAAVPSGQLVVQPESRGTAPAILYSLLRVTSVHPDATVAFFPSDHHFSDEERFMAAVERGFSAAEMESEAVVLVGIEAESPETSYGWIEPEESLVGGLEGSVTRVKRFWEKPERPVAEYLRAKGALWNSFVMMGKASAFLSMFERCQPQMYRMFMAGRSEMGKAAEAAVIRSVYSWLDETNFSSDVLETSADKLRVLRTANVGWSDLGEPVRVEAAVRGLAMNPAWLRPVAA